MANPHFIHCLKPPLLPPSLSFTTSLLQIIFLIFILELWDFALKKERDMDPKDIDDTNNYNNHPYYNDDNSPPTKRNRPSPPTCFEGGFVAAPIGGAEHYELAELISTLMKPFVIDLVQMEVRNAIQTHFPPHILESLREKKDTREEVLKESETEKYKLVFFNEPGSIIFTNNDIKAENGESLKVVILDAKTNANICTGALSSAQLEFFLLDGDHGGSAGQQHFHRLSSRDGKRPLLVGHDMKLNLENGVAYIHSLSITDNSSWIKSKKFCLAVKIRDDKTLSMFDPVTPAISQPFRVMDRRGEGNKKHHPPRSNDEVWRLEGIRKDGPYHRNLSSHDIKNVGDFLKAYQEKGPTSLKKLLGNKVPNKTWNMMVANAKESINPPTCKQISKKEMNEWAYKVIGEEPPLKQAYEVYEEKDNSGYGSLQNLGMEVVLFAEDFE